MTTLDELDALIAELRAAGEFALRVIPDHWSAMRAAIVGVSVLARGAAARYVPIGHESSDDSGDLLARPAHPRRSTAQTALERLRPLLEDPSVRKVGHDLKFDLMVLANHGITLRGIAFDSMIASYLLDATRSGHPIEDGALEQLGYRALTEDEVCGKGAKAQSLARLSPETILTFAGERADLAWQLSRALPPLLSQTRSSIRSCASWRCRSCRSWPTSSAPAS